MTRAPRLKVPCAIFSPQRRFPQQLSSAAEITGEVKTDAPILLGLVQRYMKIVKFDFILVHIKISTADLGGTFRMIRTPSVTRVKVPANANA